MHRAYEALEQDVLEFVAAGESTGFEALALRVFEFQRAENSAYRAHCGGVLVTRWEEIPALPQAAFRHAALRAFPESETAKTFRTSGTTGEGFGEHHFRSTRLYDAAILAGWEALGLPPLPQCILAQSPASAPHSSLSHMLGTLGARAPRQDFFIGAPGQLDHSRLTAALEKMREPVLLLGTALGFLAYFDHLAPRSIALPPGSVAMETGGYKGSGRSLTKSQLYALFSDRLDLPASAVINEYGMTELSSQFYTRGLGGHHVAPPWVRPLVIDPETGREALPGQVGALRIFDLANLGSCLAVQTSDLAVARSGGFELLGRDPAALPRGCSRAADDMLSR